MEWWDTNPELTFDHTVLHPVGVIALVVLGLATLVLPRRYALVPALILACFVAPAQRIAIATLDMSMLRMIVLIGWCRVLLRLETTGFRWKTMDTVFASWCLCAFVTGSMLWGTASGALYRAGIMYDAAGWYFLIRVLVRGWDDVFTIARSAAVISIPVGLLFMVEKVTGRNFFAFFGGVPSHTIVREGRLRCQGPFEHSIFAGCFWASLMPIIAALWWSNRRVLGAVGIASAVFIVFASGSATPIGAMMIGVMAAALFPVRRYMTWIRWGTAGALCMMQIVMRNPLWHLLTRFDLGVQGATGWYRYKLIDEFIRHFPEWALLGTFAYTSWPGPGFEAITNEYVRQGVDGGFLTLSTFVLMIVTAFFVVGRILRRATQLALGPHVAMAWGLGVALFIHCVAFIGVSYFGQVLLVWYLPLACIGSLMPSKSVPMRVRRPLEHGFKVHTPATA